MKYDNPYLLFKKKNILFWICFPILFILSIVYRIATFILKFLYKKKLLPTYRPKCRVISVGNITVGGTGKTPLVEWIVNVLKENNRWPGVIIRGYKRPMSKQAEISSEDSSYLEIGDEASMLKESISDINIRIGRDKIKSAKELESKNCNVLVLDDGFQHWRLHRDLDIVAIDCSYSLSNQRLLPLGRLREPLNSLRRADIFVLTKTDLSQDKINDVKTTLRKINPKAAVVSSAYQPVCFHDLSNAERIPTDSEFCKDKPVFIIAGIANPLYFDKILSDLSLKIKRELVYPDHYQYKKSDLDNIKQLAKELSVDTIITTHKDAVRLKPLIHLFAGLNLFYLKIKLKVVEGEEEFINRILSVSNS